FADYPQKIIHDEHRKLDLKPLEIPADLTFRKALDLIFRHLGVASKAWAVHKVDRSVTGKVNQQQCVGPLQIPLSNYSAIQFSPFSNVGEANSHAVRPRIGFISAGAMVRMTLAEAMIKLMLIKVTDRKDIKISGNWMLAAKLPGGMAWLYDATVALRDALEATGIDEDGGKDSSSMAAKTPSGDGSTEIVKSPSTFVLSTYVGCPDLTKKLTPDIKEHGNSRLIFIDIAKGKMRLGGSVFAQCLNQIGLKCPDIDDNNFDTINKTFDLFQKLLDENLILSAHKKSKGGLITTLCEMAFGGNCGIEIELKHQTASVFEMFLNEEAGLIIECLIGDESDIYQYFYEVGLGDIIYTLGHTTTEKKITVIYNGENEITESTDDLRALWSETSYNLELIQSTVSCANSERRNTYTRSGANYKLTFDPDKYPLILDQNINRHNVAIIREEGCNSDEEMKNACFAAGLMPWDVTMTDLIEERINLDNFAGIGWVAGFSFKDVFGAAKGWAGIIKYNPQAAEQIEKFYLREDTFSFGFCNGAQLMLELGLVPYKMAANIQPKFITNDSEKFESRFVSVRIGNSPAIMLNGMEGSILGVHAAHGQGKFYTLNYVLSYILHANLAPIKYADDGGNPTMVYPFNPNGSLEAIAALCSADGRHLAFMLHPERTAFKFQWHYWPKEWKRIINSPWIRMFQNARLWRDKYDNSH
ncbi:phosphoribosylformylglycinamidine synthase subunit PurQ, partial [Patescibacteria group bacterium]